MKCKNCLHYNVCGNASMYWGPDECSDFLSKKKYKDSLVYKEMYEKMYDGVLDALLTNRLELIKLTGRDI